MTGPASPRPPRDAAPKARDASQARNAAPQAPAPLGRRRFLRISTSAAGGLLVAISLPACGRDEVAGGAAGGSGAAGGVGGAGSGAPGPAAARHALDAFLEVDARGHAIVHIPVPEIGQGVRTSLAMLVAEELDVPWQRVRVVQMEAADEMGPHPMAGGSQSVRAHWLPFRRTGAAARGALIEAAAARWGVPAASLRTEEGRVVEPGGGRSAGYGELAEEAARLAAGRELDPAAIELRDPAGFRLIGTPVRHLDTPDIVRGAARFGSDVRVPGMLRAVIARCPVYGGRVRSWDDARCREVPGFRATVRVPAYGEPHRPYAVEGVAVVAESTWAAMKAREVLEVDWDEGPNAGESSAELLARARRFVSEPGETYREVGDVDAALGRAARRVRAEYSAPFLVHATMEPMNCVVTVRDGEVEIRAPTQIPLPVRRLAAEVAGVDPERVRVLVERCGGGFGRRLSADFVLEAIPVAREVRAPVQVLWTREDDVRHSMFRPLNVHRLEAALDDRGRPTGWLHRQAGTSRYAFRPSEPVARSEFRAGTYPAALVRAHRLEYRLVETNLPRGPLRAPGLNTLAWAVESFLDEVAAAAGRDPLELRLSLLRGDRELPDDEGDPPFSTRRMRAVLRRAADAAAWGRRLPPGRGLGIACGYVFGTYAAHVVEASVDRREGRIRVHRIVSAVDCGRVVNPNGVRHQVMGGALDGLGAALHGEVAVEAGAVVPSNFHDVPLLRMPEAPDVEVHWTGEDREPTGVGEPPYPPMPAAVANAVFAASGVRLRDLPLQSEAARGALL